MNCWLSVLLVSALPFAEIRGGLPLALYYGLNPLEAYTIAVLGNILPVPLLLLLLDFLVGIATRVNVVDRMYSKIIERVERKKTVVEKYGYLGLTLFVSVPLPVTGAWTGVLIAFLLRMNKVKSFLAIFAGVCIAGIIVLLVSLGVISIATIII